MIGAVVHKRRLLSASHSVVFVIVFVVVFVRVGPVPDRQSGALSAAL
jgi:hypothetical protein